jgi:hypothetical protein
MIDEIVHAAYRLGACNEPSALDLWFNRLRAENLGLELVMGPPIPQIGTMLSEAQRIALDRREVRRSIEQESRIIESRTDPLSLVRIGLEGAGSKLKSLARQLEVATPEEKPAVEAEIAHYRALHTKHAAALSERGEALIVEPRSPVVHERVDHHTSAGRSFNEVASREAVVKHAAAEHGGPIQLAKTIKVTYPMLRLWVRTRAEGLTKGPSQRVQRIERFLRQYLAAI